MPAIGRHYRLDCSNTPARRAAATPNERVLPCIHVFATSLRVSWPLRTPCQPPARGARHERHVLHPPPVARAALRESRLTPTPRQSDAQCPVPSHGRSRDRARWFEPRSAPFGSGRVLAPSMQASWRNYALGRIREHLQSQTGLDAKLQEIAFLAPGIHSSAANHRKTRNGAPRAKHAEAPTLKETRGCS